MKARIATLLALAAALALPPAAQAAPAPAWSLSVSPMPANLPPGGEGEIEVLATNVGGERSVGQPMISVSLPSQVTPFKLPSGCAVAAQVVTCESPKTVPSGGLWVTQILVSVEAGASGTSPVTATVSGGGGAEVSSGSEISFQEAPVPFTILPPGLQSPLSEDDGSPSTLAGSHPFQLTTTFALPTRGGPEGLTNSGHPHEIVLHLPPGLIGDPAAVPVLCTEVQLQSSRCPQESQVGRFTLTSVGGGVGVLAYFTTPLYAMVPPPGHPAELATNAASVGLFAHILPRVRTEGDYGIDVVTPDVLAIGTEPIFAVDVQVWGDPSAAEHDETRGVCGEESKATCPVPLQPGAFLTQPTRCPGEATTFALAADSWESPGSFVSSAYRSADLGGNEVSVSDCGSLSFSPTLSAQPTTKLADSPSGLDVDLHQPTDLDKEHRSPAQLRDATVTLPEGMAVNPSQADGLAGCSEEQIGYLAEAEGVHFSAQPASCPDASKLGTLEVTTPLLAEYEDEGAKAVTDPETGKVLPRPLHGSVYLAKPLDNPLGSLVAIYLSVEDPRSGTYAKLAGRVVPDPQTGRLTTVFTENPQLPLEDVRLHLFGGARGSLITPPTCGSHTTTSDLVPWSAPEGADAHPADSFAISANPAGGCAGDVGGLPSAPGFAAGTLTRQAGSYSPFALKISREDGTRRLAAIDTTLAPGLIGKLAGIAECSDAQIAQAEARRNPEEGILERQSPSCPLASEVGTVNVGAGAGPTPYYTQGHAYLAGPYKGAPVSLAVIVPAIAGPFDLGTVVSRVALHVEPESAQIHALSDPLPQILDGIPLDVRSVALQMDRPQFVLNPTSCNPMAITGSLASPAGPATALSTPFQVGGCSSLAFKPKLSLRLKGSVKRSATPRLIATLKAKPGEANIAAAQVKLPHPVFLDQAHIRTICTRVQFAADACPAASVYGKAEATTPLLDFPLGGPVYLRSNGGERLLPDLVAKLKGPASLPIEIDLVGKTDAVKAALRNTFEAVPDAPVSSFRLELFGGKRGLVEISDGFCRDRHATVKLTAQNGKAYDTRPVVAAKCPKGRKGAKGGKKHGHRRAGHRRSGGR